MQAVEQNLKSFLATLSARPLERQTLDTLAERTLSQTQATANPESWKNRWEYVLRKEIFDLAVRYLAQRRHRRVERRRVCTRRTRSRPRTHLRLRLFLLAFRRQLRHGRWREQALHHPVRRPRRRDYRGPRKPRHERRRVRGL
ncbi:hypothetical protein C8Q74DRAFT_494710 [Fomes fomentarius]|nr:hypothetical protein C8Q74DRAFT_494710 [Fomes fomentarius]